MLRSRFLRMGIAWFLVFSLFGLNLQSAWACVCPTSKEEPAVAFADADAVFAGTVTSSLSPSFRSTYFNLLGLYHKLAPPLPTLDYPPLYNQVIIFDVDQSWKGIAENRTTLVTPHNRETGCGFTFSKGENYLVYSRMEAGHLQTSLCTRTSETENAVEDLIFLQSVSKLTLSPARPTFLIICIVPLLAGVIVTMLFFWRRRARVSPKSIT